MKTSRVYVDMDNLLSNPYVTIPASKIDDFYMVKIWRSRLNKIDQKGKSNYSEDGGHYVSRSGFQRPSCGTKQRSCLKCNIIAEYGVKDLEN